MRKFLLLGVMAFVVCNASLARSKLPPDIPIMIADESVVFSFKLLLDETNDGEIREIAVCRRFGSRCTEDVWKIEFPHGLMEQEVRLFQTYPQAVELNRNPSALHADGSYYLYVKFHERGRRKKQTVSSMLRSFCLVEEGARLQLQSPHECIARRVREDKERRELSKP